jgi:hypothetical protein
MNRAIAALALAIGCGSEPAPRVPSNSSGERAATGPRMTCYLRAGHIPPDMTIVVLVRTLDPAQHMIVERRIGDDAELILGNQTFTVSGARFSDLRDAITHAEGELEGPPWQWTAWTTSRRINDGTTLKTWTLANDRGLVEHAVVHYPDGVD